jgi:histidine ammonia-lyase
MLADDPGLNSGFMALQYTAAALVSENKVLCHPASVDSIPTCLGQEDHVSMGSVSARKLLRVLENVQVALALELLMAAQALDYTMPRDVGHGVAAAHARIRSAVDHADGDREFGEDIAHAVGSIIDGTLLASVEHAIGRLR